MDLQLLEVIYRRENPSASTTKTPQSSFKNKRGGRRNRRSQRTDEVEKIYGFGRCLELYLQDEKLVKIKDKGRELLEEDDELWTKRPLTDELIQYCVVDTMAMFRLYNEMKDVNGGEQARLRVASDKYVDLYRGKTERSFDEYETNAYLPLDIIPDKGTLGFPVANTVCTRCHRRFPHEEFSVTQLRKGEQKCRVCKEVKRLEDVQQNREDNWERNACAEEDYVYIPEGMSDYAWVWGHEPWENYPGLVTACSNRRDSSRFENNIPAGKAKRKLAGLISRRVVAELSIGISSQKTLILNHCKYLLTIKKTIV